VIAVTKNQLKETMLRRVSAPFLACTQPSANKHAFERRSRYLPSKSSLGIYMQKTVRTLMLSSALLYSGFAAAQATAVERPQQLGISTLDPSVSVLSSPLEKWHQEFLHDTRASNWSSRHKRK
jgi:hypothetical protein